MKECKAINDGNKRGKGRKSRRKTIRIETRSTGMVEETKEGKKKREEKKARPGKWGEEKQEEKKIKKRKRRRGNR